MRCAVCWHLNGTLGSSLANIFVSVPRLQFFYFIVTLVKKLVVKREEIIDTKRTFNHKPFLKADRLFCEGISKYSFMSAYKRSHLIAPDKKKHREWRTIFNGTTASRSCLIGFYTKVWSQT